MRVVAGTARGRRLVAPKGTDTRPTSDRVREAIFNALGSRDALVDARVLDLFAGSGALGVEALSRGAARATFVDDDREALESVHANLTAAGLTDRADVVQSDAWRYLDRGSSRSFDVTFLDPPYAFDRWPELLERAPGALAVVESDRVIDPGESWELVRDKRYGSTFVAIVRRRTSH